MSGSIVDDQPIEGKEWERYMTITEASCTIPTFDGNNMPVSSFVRQCQETLELIDPDDSHIFERLVRSRIRGGADTFLQGKTISNLDELLTIIKNEYVPMENINENYFGTLQGETLRNPGETLAEYGARINAIAEKTIHNIKRNMTYEKAEKVIPKLIQAYMSNFIRNLDGTVSRYLSGTIVKNVSDIVNAALSIERNNQNLLNSRRTSAPVGHNGCFSHLFSSHVLHQCGQLLPLSLNTTVGSPPYGVIHVPIIDLRTQNNANNQATAAQPNRLYGTGRSLTNSRILFRPYNLPIPHPPTLNNVNGQYSVPQSGGPSGVGQPPINNNVLRPNNNYPQVRYRHANLHYNPAALNNQHKTFHLSNMLVVAVHSTDFVSNACSFLLDTGACINVLKESRLKRHVRVDRGIIHNLQGINRVLVPTLGRAEINLHGNVKCQIHLVSDDFPGEFDGVLGIAFLKTQNATLSLNHDSPYLVPPQTEVIDITSN